MPPVRTSDEKKAAMEAPKAVMTREEVLALDLGGKGIDAPGGLPLPAPVKKSKKPADVSTPAEAMEEDSPLTIEQIEYNVEATERLALMESIGEARNIEELCKACPVDYRGVLRASLQEYHSNMGKAANARKALATLDMHKVVKSFPTSFNSIAVPSLQFSSEYSGQGESYEFSAQVGKEVHALKLSALDKACRAKEKEVVYLEKLSSTDTTTQRLRDAFINRLAGLKTQWPGLSIMGGAPQQSPAVKVMLERANSTFELASYGIPFFLNKSLEIIRSSEDVKLQSALSKMSIESAAKTAAAESSKTALTKSDLKPLMDSYVKELRKELANGRGGPLVSTKPGPLTVRAREWSGWMLGTTGKQSKPKPKSKGKGVQASQGSSAKPAKMSKKKDKALKAAKKEKNKKAGKGKGSGGGKSGKA